MNLKHKTNNANEIVKQIIYYMSIELRKIKFMEKYTNIINAINSYYSGGLLVGSFGAHLCWTGHVIRGGVFYDKGVL